MQQIKRIVSRFWAIALCVGMLSGIPAIAAFGQTEVTEPPGDARNCLCNNNYCQITGGSQYMRWCCSGDNCGCTLFTNC